MKKQLIRVFLFSIITLIMLSVTKTSYAATFKNYKEYKKSTYVVAYGKEISITKSSSETVKSNNTKIAKVSGNKLKIIGVGNFTVTVKKGKTEKKIKFFAYNACQKKGTYYTYTDVNRTKKSKGLKGKAYLAVETTQNSKTFKIKDYFFTTGSYSGTLKGKYIVSCYDSSTKKSKNRYWEYSFGSGSTSSTSSSSSNSSSGKKSNSSTKKKSTNTKKVNFNLNDLRDEDGKIKQFYKEV